jgi:hypothetical protein
MTDADRDEQIRRSAYWSWEEVGLLGSTELSITTTSSCELNEQNRWMRNLTIKFGGLT